MRKFNIFDTQENLTLVPDEENSSESTENLEIRMDNFGYISIKDYSTISDMECSDVLPLDYKEFMNCISHPEKNHFKNKKEEKDVRATSDELIKSELMEELERQLQLINGQIEIIKKNIKISNKMINEEMTLFMKTLTRLGRVNQALAIQV